MITEINKDNFEKEVLRSEKPVVADFWAPWCGYCRRLAPAIDRLESEYGDKLKFVKIDTDDNAALADEYGVDTIPTLIARWGSDCFRRQSWLAGSRRGMAEGKGSPLT